MAKLAQVQIGEYRPIITVDTHEVECKRGDIVIVEVDRSSEFARVVTLTLPPAAVPGTTFAFAVQLAHELRVAPGAAAIRDDSGQTAGKYKSAGAVGASLTVVADANGDWATIAKNGTWTQEL